MSDDVRRDAHLLARLGRLTAVAVAMVVVAELLAATGIVAEPWASTLAPIGFGQFFAMAMLGTFVVHLWCGPPPREALATLALALLAEGARVAWQRQQGWGPAALAVGTGLGAGAASLAAQSWLAWRARGDERQRRLVVLLACVLIDLFVLLSSPFVSITAPLHPLTLDALVYAFDDSLGGQACFFVGRFFRAWPGWARACEVVYLATPFGFALLWAAQRRARGRAPIDVMTAFLVASSAGFALYHAFPVVGPVYVVGNGFPYVAPSVASVGLVPRLAPAVARNCMPSLHTTWVLLLWWHSRGRGLVIRAVAATFLTMTLLATLGNGLHYVADLMVAVPFAATAQALSAPPSRVRRTTLAIASALVAAWLVVLRTALLVRHPRVWLSWTLALATVAAGLLLEQRLWAASAAAPDELATSAAPAPTAARNHALLVTFAAASAAAMVYAAGAARALALTFGFTAGTALATVATLLAAGGAGVVWGDRAAAVRRDPLHLVAACAGASALFCAALPSLVRGVRGAALLLGGGREPGSPSLTLLQLGLGALVLAPPALLLGVMVSPLARRLDRRTSATGSSVTALAAAGALGVAAAALALGDLLWPALGIAAPTWIAAAVDLGVVLLALRQRPAGVVAPTTVAPTTVAPTTVARATRRLAPVALAAGLAAIVATVDAHLFLAVVGDTTWAIAAMLGCGWLALGAGALAARRRYERGGEPAAMLAATGVLAAASVLAGALVWSRLPAYFASYEVYPLARNFGAREVVRLFACAIALAPTAALAGAGLAAALPGRAGTAAATTRAAAATTGAIAAPTRATASDDAAAQNRATAPNKAAAQSGATTPNEAAAQNRPTAPNKAAAQSGATTPNDAAAQNRPTTPNDVAAQNRPTAPNKAAAQSRPTAPNKAAAQDLPTALDNAVAQDRASVSAGAAPATGLAVAAFGAAAGVAIAAPVVARLGSLHTLHACAAVAAIGAVAAAARAPAAARARALAPLVAVAALALAQPRAFDWAALGSGAHVFFSGRDLGDVVGHAESLGGGVAVVGATHDVDGTPARTLLHDGHIVGDDSIHRALPAEWARALAPLLHARARDRALVVGPGAGFVAAALADAGFGVVDVVDPSPALLLRVARDFGRPRRSIRAHVADGRAWLLSRGGYDLVTIDGSDPWRLTVAPRCTREAFAAAAAALGEHGVFAQSLPLARLDRLELAALLAAAHAAFPQLSLYATHDVGTLVGCASACAPTPATLARLDGTAALQPALAALGGHAADAAAHRLLDTAAIERLITTVAGSATGGDDLAASDDDAFFETHGAAAATRPRLASLKQNLSWLATFAAP
jgi:hypothetical protein